MTLNKIISRILLEKDIKRVLLGFISSLIAELFVILLDVMLKTKRDANDLI